MKKTKVEKRKTQAEIDEEIALQIIAEEEAEALRTENPPAYHDGAFPLSIDPELGDDDLSLPDEFFEPGPNGIWGDEEPPRPKRKKTAVRKK